MSTNTNMDSDSSTTQPSERVLLARQVLMDRIGQLENERDRQYIHNEVP